MAKKKTRRVPRSSTPRMYGDGSPSQATQQLEGSESQPAPSTATGAAPTQSQGTARPSAITGRTAATRSAVPLAEEYRYVGGDLKRLGIQAAVTFTALIALGIIFSLVGR
jgi:hypothetical protein